MLKHLFKYVTCKGFSKSLEGISWTGNVGNGVQYFPYKLLNKKFNVDVFEESDEVTSFKQGEACTIMYSKVEISDYTYLNHLNSIFIIFDKPICMTAF